MRILRPNNSGRPWPARKPKAAGILTGILVACSALAATNASSSNSENASAAQPPASEASGAAPAAARSPGIAEILNMLDSKVDPGVIKAYIQNSSVAYNPSAAEIIALKQQGVPTNSSRRCCSEAEN